MANILQIETLKLFCDLVEAQSFSRAAERNFVSQSAVSQRLRALEREYGRSLIDRGQGRGGVTPTPAGQLLYDGAKRLLREANALDALLRNSGDEVGGTIRVATVYSVGLHALPPRLKPFLAAHPKVNVHLQYQQTEEIYREVMDDSVDIGIVACPVAKRGLETFLFSEEEMVLICAPEHPLAGRASVALKDLDGVAFIGFDNDIPTRKLIEARLQRAGARVRLTSTFDNIETIKSIVEIGNGVSVVPADTIRQEVREGALVAVPFTEGDTFLRPTGLLVKKSNLKRSVVQVFVNAMTLGRPPENRP
ncbi:transcriptional regulator [Capsulimonas corticalis]|uniref:Transcriptional regulator n=1 Tax=Capsulimonas corticalis TaxID=2219043 RepID=A0A402CQH7_9BACT|nr:LysR family transcriptional regulator [Capsulimonas corticalis]BDI32704.1 transcriptional regulator [Capsulimonas corticalis]